MSLKGNFLLNFFFFFFFLQHQRITLQMEQTNHLPVWWRLVNLRNFTPSILPDCGKHPLLRRLFICNQKL